jgi:hypothetical protein
MRTDSLTPIGVIAIGVLAATAITYVSLAVPPAPPEPKLFELVAATSDPAQLRDSFTVYFETAVVLGTITNQWTARTNMPGSKTNVFVLETADFMLYRYAVSNATYGRMDFPDQVVAKEAAPAPREFYIRHKPVP